MLEDALREMMAAKAAQAPALHDPAAEAVRRGRAARRRRLAGTSVAAALVLVLALTAAVFLQARLPSARGVTPIGPGRPTADPQVSAVDATPAPRTVLGTGIAVDLVAGDQLWTAAGQLLTLSGVSATTRAYRVPAGWVYGGADQVRLMRPDGSSVALSGQGDSWVLTPDGNGIAFVVGRTLHVGHVGTAGLAITGSVDLDLPGVPVGFVGNRVMVARDGLTTGERRVELVDPTRSGVVWGADLAALYSTRGTEVVALARTAEGLCLVGVRTSDGTIARRGGCALGLTPGAAVVASPDGARLAVRSDAGVRVLDLTEVWRGRSGAVSTCPVGGDGPLAWADRSTVLAGAGGTVTRCTVTGGRDTVRLPAETGTAWRFATTPTAR